SAAWSQSGTDVSQGDWPDYNGNMAAQRYSPLDQINADNVESLRLAWRFSTSMFGPQPEFNNTSTPLEVDGVLYATAGSTRNVIAIDATSGQLLWMWRPRSEEHTSELQSRENLVCRLLLEKTNIITQDHTK